MSGEADEIVCPVIPTYLGAVGQFYEDFHQVNDGEVIALLAQAPAVAAAPS